MSVTIITNDNNTGVVFPTETVKTCSLFANCNDGDAVPVPYSTEEMQLLFMYFSGSEDVQHAVKTLITTDYDTFKCGLNVLVDIAPEKFVNVVRDTLSLHLKEQIESTSLNAVLATLLE